MLCLFLFLSINVKIVKHKKILELIEDFLVTPTGFKPVTF